MANQLISIADAADLINKSAQTIRRLIKAGKIKYRRKRTPQGFNYMIDKASLMEACGMTTQTEQPIIEQQQVQEPVKEPVLDQSTYAVQKEPEIYVLKSHEESQQPQSAFVEAYDAPIQEPQSEPVMSTHNPNNQTTIIIEKLLEQQRVDKEKLYQVLEAYQSRVSILEQQVKQLEGPKKRWWHFGK